jgi:hypothetical protein
MAEQRKTLAYIEEAMDMLEDRYKRQPAPLEVQAYLYAEHQMVVSLEDVKRNGDIVLEFRHKNVFEDVYSGIHQNCQNKQCLCHQLQQPLPDASDEEVAKLRVTERGLTIEEARASLLM